MIQNNCLVLIIKYMNYSNNYNLMKYKFVYKQEFLIIKFKK